MLISRRRVSAPHSDRVISIADVLPQFSGCSSCTRRMAAEPEVRQQPRQPGQLPFAAVCELFDSLAGQKTATIRQLVRRFVQAALPDGSMGAYQLIRWVEPSADIDGGFPTLGLVSDI